MKPHRVQLSRSAGWKIPPNTVNVARPTRWGNPFVTGKHGTREQCIELYRRLVAGKKVAVGDPGALHATRVHVLAHVKELRGKNLACWCPLDGICHADVLLALANVE